MKKVSLEEFEYRLDQGLLDEEYAEFIMEQPAGERVICNGDDLLSAMEDGYLFDEFRDHLVDEPVDMFF